MNDPLFSIITVTYNAANTIPATLKSIKEQKYRNFEFLVIDGNSSDNTLELIEKAAIHEAIVKSEPDNGLYDAMNKGLDMAKGTYLIFLNAGDAFDTPNTLKIICDTVLANNYPGIVYGDTRLVNNKRDHVGMRHLSAPETLTFKSFNQGMLVCHQAFIVLRSIAPKYDLQYKYSADYEWCLKCLQRSHVNANTHTILISYLAEGITTNNHKASLKERFDIMTKYYGTMPTIMRHFKFAWRDLKRRSATTPPQ